MGFTEDIAAGRCGSFYLIVCPEEYLRVDATRRWLATQRSAGDPVVHRFRAPRWDLTEIEGVMLTLSMFGENVAVVINDLERTPAAQQQRLAAILAARGPHVSVLVLAGAIDKRKKLYKSLVALGPVEERKKIYENRRPGWVHRIAGDLGWTISGEATQTIAELIGESLLDYEAELRKIILYIGEKRRIEKADVDQVLFADTRFGDFAIAEAVGQKDLARALRVMRQVYTGSAYQSNWMPLLSTTIFRLLRLKAAPAIVSDNELAGEMKMNPYVVKLLRAQAARFAKKELLDGIQALYQAERDIKTSTLPALSAAELFLIKLIKGNQNNAERSPSTKEQ